jgi:hypothetical protein
MSCGPEKKVPANGSHVSAITYNIELCPTQGQRIVDFEKKSKPAYFKAGGIAVSKRKRGA